MCHEELISNAETEQKEGSAKIESIVKKVVKNALGKHIKMDEPFMEAGLDSLGGG